MKYEKKIYKLWPRLQKNKEQSRNIDKKYITLKPMNYLHELVSPLSVNRHRILKLSKKV